MLRHRDNSKRVIALLGVMLALSSGFQSAHLLCALGGCEVVAAESPSSGETHVCCHSHHCHAGETASQSESDQSRHHSCPCPPECWCHQSPQPLELPRSAPEPTELLLQGFVCSPASTILAANYDVIFSHNAAWAHEALAVSSVEQCAQLCRFLI